MSRVLLVLVLAAPLLAQELSSSQFETRRRALRDRYLAAKTAEEKRTILAEFAALRLDVGAGTGSSGGGSGELEGALLEGIEAAKGVQAGTTSGGAGLGTGVDNARIQELERIIAATERELSNPYTPRWSYLNVSSHKVGEHTLKEAAADTIEGYLTGRDSLEVAFLEPAKEELANLKRGGQPSGNFEATQLDDWGQLLEDTGIYRRWIADWLQVHFRNEIALRKSKIQSLQRDLTSLQGSLASVVDAIKRKEEAKRLVKFVLDMKDLAEALQDIAAAIADPSKITEAVANQIQEKLDGTDDIIVDGIENLGNYMVQVELASEGFSSVSELVSRIQSTLRQVREAESLLASDVAFFEEAVSIENKPRWEHP